MKRSLIAMAALLPSLARAQTPSSAPSNEDLAARLARVEAELAALKANPPQPSPLPAHAGGTVGPISTLAESTTKEAPKASYTVGAYAEIFYQWNFNEPSNGITAERGFDNRHNSITVANAVLDAAGSLGPVSAHVALQIGHTPESYYLAEPSSPGGGGAGPSNSNVWKFIQQANVTWVAPLGRGLTLDAGIFLSPIGPEGMAIKDQWNWSRSDLFFGLPFYHTGFRVTYPFTERLTTSLQVYNGWNSVVDNNAEKSLAGQVTYTIPDKLTLNALYFTGVERPTNAPEGRAWRHLFDVYVAVTPKPWLSALLHVDGGFEPNNFGTSGWAAAALYLRGQPVHWLYLAARGDFFYEWVPTGAAPIFWSGAKWISSFTGTVDFRPSANLSFRVEYRHDHAEAPLYFANTVLFDRMGNPIANARTQNTITVGAVAWF
jgi:hypothetical protein